MIGDAEIYNPIHSWGRSLCYANEGQSQVTGFSEPKHCMKNSQYNRLTCMYTLSKFTNNIY